MTENQQRRQGRRQQRGLLRVEEILQVAGGLFAEIGYDRTTTNMIAAKAGISTGSLYQYFPNKETIAHSFAAYTTTQLHQVYDTILSPEVTSMPLQTFVDNFVEAIIAFNRKYPGYLVLSIGSTISTPLAVALADLHKGIQARLDAVLATRWPQSTPEQRQVPLQVSFSIFLALLPMTLEGKGEHQQAIVQEMKVVFYRYWEPMIGLVQNRVQE